MGFLRGIGGISVSVFKSAKRTFSKTANKAIAFIDPPCNPLKDKNKLSD
ncbi:hypothetical protein [Helicobacter cetorum]|nr:hypothetical protein [Helicobacter cetorum]